MQTRHSPVGSDDLDWPRPARYGEAMSTKPTAPVFAAPDRTLVDRVLVILEVFAAFCLVHLAYRSFKHFTELGRLEVATGLNFSPGTAMILFTVAMLFLGRRNLAEYGLTLKGWRYNLNVGLLWAVIEVAAGAEVMLSPVHLDPLHPPDLPRAVLCSLGLLTLTLFLVLFLMRERGWVRAVPPAVAFAALLGLLGLPLIVAWCFGRPLPAVVLTVLWLFFGAGFGEEVFFRGYIQSRVNEAFGRPFTVLGSASGLGCSSRPCCSA